jgi:hypothetical protein
MFFQKAIYETKFLLLMYINFQTNDFGFIHSCSEFDFNRYIDLLLFQFELETNRLKLKAGLLHFSAYFLFSILCSIRIDVFRGMKSLKCRKKNQNKNLLIIS